MQIGDIAIFKLGIGVKSGIVIQINDKTFHAKLKNGNTVKRHILKHLISSENLNDKINPNS